MVSIIDFIQKHKKNMNLELLNSIDSKDPDLYCQFPAVSSTSLPV